MSLNPLVKMDLVTDQPTDFLVAPGPANPYSWFGVPFRVGRTTLASLV
jgi:hypothetical protein